MKLTPPLAVAPLALEVVTCDYESPITTASVLPQHPSRE